MTCKLRGAQDARGAEDAREEGGHYDAYPMFPCPSECSVLTLLDEKNETFRYPPVGFKLYVGVSSFSANETDFSSCRFNLDAETGSAGHNLTTNS